jgi:cytochrome c peroxidase
MVMLHLSLTGFVRGLTAATLVASTAMGAHADELSPLAQLGRLMFFDPSLSASGKLACSSCHDPAHAYSSPNGLAVQVGGSHLTRTGIRAVPSLRYKEATPPYADLLDNPDGISTPGPGGGLMQDGRAATLAEQARLPLLNPIEMGNRSARDVSVRLRRAAYASTVSRMFGPRSLAQPVEALDVIGQALQAFQMEDPSFHPYSSRYDLYAGNKIGGTMSAAEARGFAVYNDPAKGNCFACHYNGAGLNGSVALFTDFTYAAIGVPRNSQIPANGQAGYADLGLCSRPDHRGAANAQYCGEFKTPTLRNVATRSVFFHNGRMKSLADVILFYNTRDTDPGHWYPKVGGVVQKFDDLPRRYRGNVDTQKPLDGRAPGSTPPMTDQEMADLESFLGMLTDRDVVALARPIAEVITGMATGAPTGTRTGARTSAIAGALTGALTGAGQR